MGDMGFRRGMYYLVEGAGCDFSRIKRNLIYAFGDLSQASSCIAKLSLQTLSGDKIALIAWVVLSLFLIGGSCVLPIYGASLVGRLACWGEGLLGGVTAVAAVHTIFKGMCYSLAVFQCFLIGAGVVGVLYGDPGLAEARG